MTAINISAVRAAVEIGEVLGWPLRVLSSGDLYYSVPCYDLRCVSCSIGIDIGVQSDQLPMSDVSNVSCPLCGAACTGATYDDEVTTMRGRGKIIMECGTTLCVCGTKVTALVVGKGCAQTMDDVI